MTSHFKKVSIYSTIVLFAFILSGCAPQKNTHIPTDFFFGSIYKFFAKPIYHLMEWIANIINGPNAFGYSIIIITLIVRLILLPIMLNQAKKMTEQQERMKNIQPQLNLIKDQLKKAAGPEDQAQLQKKMMQVYKENNVSMLGGIGCLPILIQLPIFSGLYMAIQYSPEISKATFLGISLGKPNIFIAIVASLMYVVQSWISLQSMSEDQRKTMATSIWISPIMTFMISAFAPAGLAIYFAVGGLIALIQQLITSYLILPRVRKRLDMELAENPVVAVVTPEDFAVNVSNNPSPQNKKPIIDEIELTNLNSGKQTNFDD